MECPECGDTIHRDDTCWSDRYGDYLCESCHYSLEEEGLPEWDVYSHDYVMTRDTFVNPTRDFYSNDTFHLIKSKRYVGLEIETNFKYDVSLSEVSHDINLELSQTRQPNTDSSTLGKSFMTHDGSVTNSRHPYGGELVMTPRRGDLTIHDADHLCKSLERNWEAYASFKTGLHLHIDVVDYDWMHCAVLTFMTKLIEPHLYTWLPKSRYQGANGQCWSRPVSQSVHDFKYISDRDSFAEFYYDNGGYTNEKYNDKRYSGLNWHSHFQAQQGVEIRYHSGTLQKDKIKHWVKFWTAVVDKSWEIGQEFMDNYHSFGETPMYESIVLHSGVMSKVSEMVRRYDRVQEDKSTDLIHYRKSSEMIRRYLGLKNVGETYLLQPMLHFLRYRHERTFMSVQNIFDIFDIDYSTRNYFQRRRQMLHNSMERYVAEEFYNKLFYSKDSIVELDKDTYAFKYVNIFGDTFRLAKEYNTSHHLTNIRNVKGDVNYEYINEHLV